MGHWARQEKIKWNQCRHVALKFFSSRFVPFPLHGEQRLILENCLTDGTSFEQPLETGVKNRSYVVVKQIGFGLKEKSDVVMWRVNEQNYAQRSLFCVDTKRRKSRIRADYRLQITAHQCHLSSFTPNPTGEMSVIMRLISCHYINTISPCPKKHDIWKTKHWYQLIALTFGLYITSM